MILGQPVGRHGFVPERRHCFFTQGKIFFWAVLHLRPHVPTCAHLCVREPRQIYLTTVQKMRIESQAFFENQEVTSVELPMGTTEIGSWAYSRCHKLQHVTLPPTVTKLGHGAFSCCPNLRTVVAPGVTSLGEGVFAFDENLERVVMPRVQRLPADTFRYCGNLRT